MLDESLAELGLNACVESICIDSWEAARSHQFPGSPTIRLDGADIDPEGAALMGVALTCRTYLREDSGFSPLPLKGDLVAAIKRAANL